MSFRSSPDSFRRFIYLFRRTCESLRRFQESFRRINMSLRRIRESFRPAPLIHPAAHTNRSAARPKDSAAPLNSSEASLKRSESLLFSPFAYQLSNSRKPISPSPHGRSPNGRLRTGWGMRFHRRARFYVSKRSLYVLLVLCP